MTEKVLKLLAAMGADTSQEELLTPLCQAVQDSLARRLRPGVTAEDCGEAFPCAAAFTAAADLAAARDCGGVSGFTAGSVSVQARSPAEAGTQAAELRRTAWRLMAPFAVPGDFAFQGVRG